MTMKPDPLRPGDRIQHRATLAVGHVAQREGRVLLVEWERGGASWIESVMVFYSPTRKTIRSRAAAIRRRGRSTA